MDTAQMKSFIAVANTLNFTEAARQNFITQPAISRQIKELEESLGVKLLYRTRQSVTLTEEGTAFLRFAEEQLENEREIRNILQNISRGNSGMLRIALLTNMSEILMRTLSEFNQQFPSIQFTVDQVSGTEFSSMLRGKKHHFYLGNTTSFTATHGLTYIETHEEHFVLIANERIAEQINPDDISTYENLSFAFISHNIGPLYFDRIISFCTSRGYHPPLMSYFNSAEAVMLAVNAGIGISITTESFARNNIMPHVRALPFSENPVAMIGAIGWRGEKLNDTAQKYLDVLRAIYPIEKHPEHTT